MVWLIDSGKQTNKMNNKTLKSEISQAKEKLLNGGDLNLIKSSLRKKYGVINTQKILLKSEKIILKENEDKVLTLLEENKEIDQIRNSLDAKLHESMKDKIIKLSMASFKNKKIARINELLCLSSNLQDIIDEVASIHFGREDVIGQINLYYDNLIAEQKGERNVKIFSGLGLVVLGIFITFLSKFILVNLMGGNSYFFTYGLIIGGLGMFFQGVMMDTAVRVDLSDL